MSSASALEAIERILNRGGDPDEVLQAVLEAIRDRGVPFAAVRSGRRVLSVGRAGDAPITSSGDLTLATDDAAFVERVATLIQPYVR